ncbi:poly(U)-specific endoribonuclease-B-like [Amphiura filiformis]|uniref:poly(U)-specific endoribonuclease-B-like n=1 Tax=Amphiura filiformis TaxID=82378 RepID=UPI003B21AABA
MASGSDFKPDKDLSTICTKLWKLDTNRLVPGVDYSIDLQGYTRVSQRQDRADDPLFSHVNDNKLQQIPTFKFFIALLDNYSQETGVPEEVTEQEVQENWSFLNAAMETEVMKKAHRYLAKKKLVPKDEKQFKEALYDLWFKLYSRTRGMGRGNYDSSGFEHVFVGESRGHEDNREVTGFHNWIQFYLQEKAGHIDYKGWVPPRGVRRVTKKDRPNEKTHLLSLQFAWKSDTKPVGSSFIGTSPEFEMALYTVVFFSGRNGKNCIEIEDYDVEIVVHKMGDKLGSSYPVALADQQP